MKRPYADKFIRYELTYVYDGKLEKTIRGKCIFHVELKDPMIPDEKMEISSPDYRDGLIHTDAFPREQPKSQNVEKESFFRGQPIGQNVVNICNIINNNITTAATTDNCNSLAKFEKGEQIEGSRSEEVVAAVRKKFRNSISKRKIIELIQNTNLENVRNQLVWFPYRDNSWARKGPVVAFITYCEQEMSEPENIAVKSEITQKAKKGGKSISGMNESIFIEQRQSIIERRKRYCQAEKYDALKMEISEMVICDSPVANGIFKSCFIGEIRIEGSNRIMVIDTPNPFSRDWLKRDYEEKILRFFEQKSERITRLDFVSLNQ